MSEQPLRYGIVGLGRAGWNIHVKQLRPRSDARIVAVADPVAERRNEAAAEFGCSTYDSIEPMLTQADVDVVVVASPSFLHGPDSIRAMEAGKHVVVEKPVASSAAEAAEMIRISQRTGRRLFMHHNYRFNREFTHLQDVIASGVLGRVYQIRNYINSFVRRNDWQTLACNGGGVLANTGSHFIDQILQLMGGEVVEVAGDLQQIASAGDVEDHVKIFFRGDNGCCADLEISTAQNIAMPLPKWIICGTCGTLTSDGKTATIRWFDPAQAPPIAVREGAAPERRYGNDDKLPWQERIEPAVGRDVGTFYDNVYAVIRRGGPMHIEPQSVLRTMRVIEQVRASAARYRNEAAARSRPGAALAAREPARIVSN